MFFPVSSNFFPGSHPSIRVTNPCIRKHQNKKIASYAPYLNRIQPWNTEHTDRWSNKGIRGTANRLEKVWIESAPSLQRQILPVPMQAKSKDPIQLKALEEAYTWVNLVLNAEWLASALFSDWLGDPRQFAGFLNTVGHSAAQIEIMTSGLNEAFGPRPFFPGKSRIERMFRAYCLLNATHRFLKQGLKLDFLPEWNGIGKLIAPIFPSAPYYFSLAYAGLRILEVAGPAIARIGANRHAFKLRPSQVIKQSAFDLFNVAAQIARVYLSLPASQESKSHAFPNCESPDCPDLDQHLINPREWAFINAAHPFSKFKPLLGLFAITAEQELLRLNANDPREKMLLLQAEDDHNQAFTPHFSTQIFRSLNERFDLKYRLIGNHRDICEEIEAAVKTGQLANVMIMGHGSPSGIVLSYVKAKFANAKDYVRFPQRISVDTLDSFPSCFSKLPPSARIILDSCCTGAPGTIKDSYCFKDLPDSINSDPNYRPFAQLLANHAKRDVIGAITSVFGPRTKLISVDPVTFEHSGTAPFPENLYKTFHPEEE